ncbi:MAG: hypothetical protein JW809_02240, partial [Pirellulales bacterium]|nr:hypothetical protein [Pirellulales bacterium]
TAANAMAALRPAFPEATFGPGSDPQQLVAVARPADQALIKAALENMSQPEPEETAARAVVYTLAAGRVPTAIQALRTAVPRAQIAPGADPQQLVAWARPADQETIKRLLDEMTRKEPAETAPRMEVYALESAGAAGVAGALTILREAFPTATFGAGTDPKSLVAWARPEDHELIQRAVKQIDTAGEAPELRAHPIPAGDPVKLFTMLRTFFARSPGVEISLDEENDTIMAMAPPSDHEKIRQLIGQVEQGGTGEAAPQLEVYSLEAVDSDALTSVLDKLLEKDKARVQMSVDPQGDQLVVIARPKQQEIIRQTVEKMRGQKKELEILQLNVIELETAERAIEKLFDRGGFGYDPSAPTVETDEGTGQLFVSATTEQHAKIRELLVKMGESGLKRMSASDSPTTRVVPFGGDVDRALDEVRRVWPRLRANPLQVTKPGKAVEGESQTPTPEKNEATPSDKPEATEGESAANDQPSPFPLGEGSGVRAARTSVFHFASFQTPPGEKTNVEQAPSAPVAQPPSAVPDEPTQPKTTAPALPPVTLIPGHGSITVQSDDPEALAQMESLLRSLAPPTDYAVRNMEVFRLEHTDAVRVAAQLRDLFERMRPRWQEFGRERTLIVADERLNAVVVRGSRSDRATIAGLVKILDAPEAAEGPGGNQPTLLPVENTDARRVASVVTDVFRAELARGGQGEGSGRLAPQVAVDSVTNAVIVMAQEPLRGRITELVLSLDRAAGDESNRTLQLIPLRNTNAARLQDALEEALRRGRHRGGP